MKIPVAGILRFPGAGSSARGQSVPKIRPKGVVDGRAGQHSCTGRKGSKDVVGEGQWRGLMVIPCTAENCRAERADLSACKFMHPCFREKRRPTERLAVPKPTQVGGYKDTKARERNLVKELGTLAP